MRDATLADKLDATCRAHGSMSAIADRATYAELAGATHAVARVLEPFVQPGQRAALVLPNDVSFVAAFFGASRTGAVAAPLNPACTLPELTALLADLQPAAILTDAARLACVIAAATACPSSPAVIAITNASHVTLQRAGGKDAPIVSCLSSQPLLQLNTSGSTARPKQVLRTHSQLLAELDMLQQVFNVDARDRFIGVAPFFHVNGLVRTMLLAIHAGATLYPVKQFHRRKVLELLTRERITFFGGVPQMYSLLAATALRGSVDLSALRIAFSSSAPLVPQDNLHFAERYGILVRQLYGSTETGSITYNTSAHPRNSLASVGTALPGVNLHICDESDRPVPRGTEGEIAVASAHAATEYLDDPAASALAFRRRKYFTGDLGVIDEAGALTLTGRKNLLINRGGLKVNPYEVEAVLKDHPAIADAVVYGTRTPHGDEAVSCYLVARLSCPVENIIAHCRERLVDYKIPARIEFRDSLPKSATGKVLRSGL